MLRICILASLTVGLAARGASADETADAPAGQLAAQRGMQSPAGMLSARILLDLNLSADHALEPIAISPDIYYGVTDRFQIGLRHQTALGWQVPASAGPALCFNGTDTLCPHVYNNVGFDAMYGLVTGKVDLSLDTTLFFDSIDPFYASIALGVTGKAHFASSVALLFDPKFAIAVNDRDKHDDAFYMPVELELQVARGTTLRLLTALYAQLSSFGDSYRIPLGFGVTQNINQHFDLGLRFSFDNLLGNQPMMVGRADERSLALLFNVRS